MEVEVQGLGQKIRDARGRKTIKEVATLADLSRKAWHEIESEKAPAIMDATLKRIESALGVNFGIKFDDEYD